MHCTHLFILVLQIVRLSGYGVYARGEDVAIRFHETSCDPEKFPTVSLLIQNHWVDISPRDYLLKSQVHSGKCYLGFHESPVDFFVLGDTLMRGYYVIHSNPNSLVGLIPHA